MMERWREEVRNIQLAHDQEHRDLIEVSHNQGRARLVKGIYRTLIKSNYLLFGGWGCYALGIYLKPVLKLFLEDGGLIYTKVLEVI